jgi:hypothetical protein
MRRAEPVEAAARRGAAREEPPRTNGSPRPEPVRQRADITGMVVPPVMPARRAEAPSLSPAQAGGGRTGWLSELLTRASHEAEAPAREAPRETPREAPPPEAARAERHTVDSLDSLAVDIARMIDHDAVAELWDRYKRGERNVFTRKLYTMQGQKAFEEIRKRYRGDGDFKRGSLARRPRPDAGAHLSHLGDGQGLHHARPRRRPFRLTSACATNTGGRAIGAPVSLGATAGFRVHQQQRKSM